MTENQQTRNRRKTVFLGLLAAAVTAIVAGLVYESTAAAATRRDFPPPGELVDVGQYRLHLRVTGEDQGLPTVILEHGALSMSSQWGWVQSQLSAHTQVVSYDRPGLGWSELPPEQLSAETVVTDLYTALQEEGIDGPYILVGHSMGALLSRVFAQLYPEDVAGLVLVDPRDVIQPEPLPEAADPAMLRIPRFLSRFGLIRLSGTAAQQVQGLPEPQYSEAIALYPSYRHISGWEFDARLGESAIASLLEGEDLSDTALIVLDAIQPDDVFNAAQREALTGQHRQMAQHSSQGVYRPVPGAGHLTIVTQEEYARAVSEAVLELLQQ